MNSTRNRRNKLQRSASLRDELDRFVSLARKFVDLQVTDVVLDLEKVSEAAVVFGRKHRVIHEDSSDVRKMFVAKCSTLSEGKCL